MTDQSLLQPDDGQGCQIATNRAWVKQALHKIRADFNRSADTHLIPLQLPAPYDAVIYLKDESTHPTGSLKHRLARSLFLYGLCNGLIQKDRPIIEASSGSTAISEAYFAKLLGLPFIAVVPEGTASEKIKKIEFYGGQCHKVPAGDIYGPAQKLADDLGGHYMDQFTYAERVTDWRGNNNIAESLFQQLAEEDIPIPDWIVMSAGTGGTSATIGRYIRYHQKYTLTTQLCVVDPENSVFFDYYQSGQADLRSPVASRIEGIGRGRVEPSFLPSVIDRMIRIPDAASIATIHWLESQIGRKFGASTGTNLFGALQMCHERHQQGQKSRMVTLLCDPGERYLDSYYNPAWLAEQEIKIAPYIDLLTKNFGGCR